MTYEGRATRTANRVLIALVLLTVMIVVLWAVNGGLDEIATTGSEQVAVSD